MSRIYFLFTGLVLMLTVAGCSRKITSSTSTVVTDSTHEEVKPRDIFIEVPGDTVTVYKYLECDKATSKPKAFHEKIKHGRTTASIDVDDKGKMTVTCTEDSLKKVITVLDKTVFRLRHEKEEKETTRTEYKTRRIDIICRWIAAIALLFGILKLTFKFIKPI